MFSKTQATSKIFALRGRLRAVCGGTSASKTISILMWLIDRAQSHPTPELISIVSETMPHIKRGVERDFKNIMQSHNYWRDANWNATDHVYTFETGSRIEFFSADSPDKVRGPRRDILFINEANNVAYEAFDQLAVRTKNIIWLDWNPTREFWWYTDVAPHRKHEFLTLTYKDNEALDEQIVMDIESHKTNKQWWRVYGMGLLGEVEGKIYKDWAIIDDIPHEARLERYGLDFGYSVDPAAIVAIYYYNDGYIFDEIAYQKGLSNKQLSDILENQPKAMVVADSAEPKSIDEMMSYGTFVIPANKGQGSVSQGIQWVQDKRISVTKRSTNIIKEYRNYLWKQDKDGKWLPVPEDVFNHSMDALRYGMESLRPSEPEEEHTMRYSEGGRLVS